MNANTPHPAFKSSPELEKQITEIQSNYLGAEFCRSVIERLLDTVKRWQVDGPDVPVLTAMASSVYLQEIVEYIDDALNGKPYRTQAAEIARCVTDLQYVDGLPLAMAERLSVAITELGNIAVELEEGPPKPAARGARDGDTTEV